MALNVASVSLSTPSPMKHLGAFEGKKQLFIRRNKSNYNNKNASVGFSPLTIRSIKGHLVPPSEILEPTISTDNRGVVPSAVIPVPEGVTVNDFPTDFMFGCSTSALQSEGSLDVDGRGPSTWDSLVADGTAADSYNRYREDVQALKKMGVDTYRFSISWSRILPDGTIKGGINEKGIDFYNRLIDDLIKNGITPFVTLHHFDLPRALQTKYNGFLSSDIVCDFKNYADLCFERFGDRVKYWTTINEPQPFGQHLYRLELPSTTIQNPATDYFLAFHHIILAHAATVKHYRKKFQETQKGEIGISTVSASYIPYENTRQCRHASSWGMDFLIGWLLDPLVYGDYNFNMKSLVRDWLPTFTDEQKAMIKGSYDFIGVNYYSSRFAYPISFSPYQCFSDIVDAAGIHPGVPPADIMFTCPEGLKEVLLYIKREYQNPKIYITENGIADSEKQEDPLKDVQRIEFILAHLKAVLEAMKLGANVKGFINWSLIDVKELGEEGYKSRLGLVRIPFPELERIPKESSKWFHRFLSARN